MRDAYNIVTNTHHDLLYAVCPVHVSVMKYGFIVIRSIPTLWKGCYLCNLLLARALPPVVFMD
jgi:hypothetical protein